MLTSGWNLRAKPRYARLISFSVAVDDTPRVSYKDSWAAARTPSLFLFLFLLLLASIRHVLPKDCPNLSPPILLATTTTPPPPTRLLFKFKPSSFPHLCTQQRPTHKISLAKSAIPACVLAPTYVLPGCIATRIARLARFQFSKRTRIGGWSDEWGNVNSVALVGSCCSRVCEVLRRTTGNDFK